MRRPTLKSHLLRFIGNSDRDLHCRDDHDTITGISSGEYTNRDVDGKTVRHIP